MKAIFYDWGGLNVWVFHFINNIRFAYFDSLMLAGTAIANHHLFDWYIALFSCIVMIAITCKPTANATIYRSELLIWVSTIVVFCVAYVLDGWLITVLKPLLDFPRPPLALPVGTVHVLGQIEYHHSLPSGHASFVMLVVASVWPILNHWQKMLGMLLVIWVGISRINLGAHFPADVVAGWISSLAIVLLVRYVVNRVIITSNNKLAVK